jgi:hypothetical protein
MSSKKSILQNLVVFIFIAGILAASSTAFISPKWLVAEAAPSHITLTWTGDTRTTQTITWKTDVNTQAGQVQYWPLNPGEFGEQQTVAAQVAKVVSNWGEFNVHTATLTGLQPGMHYIYRVGSDWSWSEQYHFTTAQAKRDRYKFLVFGDSQSVNYDVWRTTLHQAYQVNSDAAFFVNMGDLVDAGQEYGQWYRWFNAAHGVLETIPCMPLVGNHETYVPGGKPARPTLFTDQFKLPMNGPAGLKGQVYSFDYGDVHFVMLDTQIGEEGPFVTDMLAKQKIWLADDLAASKQKWKLIFVHRPLYNNKAEGNSIIQAGFAPIIDKYHGDIVFTAHDHVYARTYPLYGGKVVNSAADGTIYVATGRSGTKTYSDSLAKDWDEFFYNPLDEPNYLTVEVAGNLLTVKAFKQSGELIDGWNITK